MIYMSMLDRQTRVYNAVFIKLTSNHSHNVNWKLL